MKWAHIEGSEKRQYVKIGDTGIRAQTWVSWAFDEEDIRGSVDFGDKEEEERYYARFRNGELVNVIIQVHATWQDAEACDFLGGCHFEAKDLAHQIVQCAEEHGMRLEALKQLQSTVIARAKLYKFKGI